MGEETLHIDQNLARRLLVEGATFLFLDLPEGTEFGIDMKSWNTGDKFKGLKMIPPGLHFIHFSAVSEEGCVAPRVGFFHYFRNSEFVVRKWNLVTEDVCHNEISDEELTRLKSNLLNLDKYLGPYPFEVWKKWKALTHKISEHQALQLSPECKYIQSALDLIASENNSEPKKKRKRVSTAEEKEDDLLPHLVPAPGTELRFNELPDRSFPPGASPAEITHHSLDSSYMLETFLLPFSSPLDVLGELQFAFVCFLVGHSLEAFEQWKKIIRLLCSCDSAVPKYREMYYDFVSVLEIQLLKIPEDFLVDIVSSNNFVYTSLRNFFFNLLTNDDVDGRLKSKTSRFKDSLAEHFQWDFSNLDKEDDDEAPVVVDIN